jgi:hypothetical protein
MKDKVEVIGIYFVDGTKEVHLLEVLVQAPPINFDVSDFTQEMTGQSKSDWQVAYDEYYLNSDGTAVIGDSIEIPKVETAMTRLTFFLYFIDFNKPLITPFGNVRLPRPTMMPARLKDIISFEDAD